MYLIDVCNIWAQQSLGEKIYNWYLHIDEAKTYVCVHVCTYVLHVLGSEELLQQTKKKKKKKINSGGSRN